MKHIALVAAVMLLGGCATHYTMTLYPRASGATGGPLKGELHPRDARMGVQAGGEVYLGEYTRGSSVFSGPAAHSAVLVTPAGKSMRCDFVRETDFGGNGICERDGQTYDVVIAKP